MAVLTLFPPPQAFVSSLLANTVFQPRVPTLDLMGANMASRLWSDTGLWPLGLATPGEASSAGVLPLKKDKNKLD